MGLFQTGLEQGYVFNVLLAMASYVALVLEAMCIAAGLYILADVAEENSALTRRILKRAVLAMVIFHCIFWLDGAPTKQALSGILCHLALTPLLIRFPFVEPLSFASIIGVCSVIVNHAIWFHYFLRNYEMQPKNMIGFFVVFVWSVPIGFFVSLTVMEDALPQANASQGMTGNPMSNGAFGTAKKKNAIKVLMDMVIPAEKVRQVFSPDKGRYQS